VNNTVWNVGQVGMLLANARNAVVKNNLIIDTGKSAIYVTSKSVKAGTRSTTTTIWSKEKPVRTPSWLSGTATTSI
jgi:parallel beta helix pectate lyase-like protein